MFNNTFFKKKFFNNKNYWNSYIPQDVSINKNFLNLKPIHYFNDIPYTKWPFFIGISLFFFLFYFVMGLKKVEFALTFSFVSLIFVSYFTAAWFYDMVTESVVFGRYNRKLRYTLMAGFFLFLISEIFLFVGFFWAFFDRMFDTSVFYGGISLPYGVEPMYKSFKPIYATLILVTSGFAANLSYYWIKYGQFANAYLYLDIAIFLGFIFLCIQAYEYVMLSFNISDSIYTTCFYMLTGFHGFHVFVGLVFLIIQRERLITCQFTKDRHSGLLFSIIYWHFVDWIWIFLFLSIYVFNWSYSYYYSWY